MVQECVYTGGGGLSGATCGLFVEPTAGEASIFGVDGTNGVVKLTRGTAYDNPLMTATQSSTGDGTSVSVTFKKAGTVKKINYVGTATSISVTANQTETYTMSMGSTSASVGIFYVTA